MGFQMFLWPLRPCRAQHILSSRFSDSALPHCASHCHKLRSRVLRALWGLFNHPGPTILPIPALQPSNQSWARATPPSIDLPGHGAQVMPKPKPCVAFLFKHQCPCEPSDKQNQQEILCWEWGEFCSEVMTLDIEFLAIIF